MLTLSPTLADLRAAHESAKASLDALVSRKFTGATVWNWYRALHAVKGELGRRNDDTSDDLALAADADIKASHDEYIRLLYVFYSARDGAGGVLGGRGL